MTRPVEMPASAGMTQGAERLGAGLPVGCVQDGEIPASAQMTQGAERFRAGLPVGRVQEGEIPASAQTTHGAERLGADLLMCSVQGRGSRRPRYDGLQQWRYAPCSDPASCAAW